MRICIFGSASNTIDDSYIKATEELGYELGKKGHSLVFGAGNGTLFVPYFYLCNKAFSKWYGN